MIKIFVVGTGNLGTHLCRWIEDGNYSAFAKAETPQTASINIDLSEVSERWNNKASKAELVGYFNKSGRDLEGISAPRVHELKNIPPSDLILIAVPDDAVHELSMILPSSKTVVAHTSGSVPMEAVSNHVNHGVFYLPQSFSKKRTPDFSKIPICIESSNTHSDALLEKVAHLFSGKIHHMDTAQRKQLHLAAIYMNNFVNHCYLKSQNFLDKAGIPATVLNPLMQETFDKAIALGPQKAQTGPALRNDLKTIATHLELLPLKEKELYQTLTKSIQKEHKS